jgi:cytochrome c oxidase subunit 3
VFAAEKGDVVRLRMWFIITFLMGAFFIGGQVYEYASLVAHEGLTIASDAYGSVFYLTTGFHGLHVTGGLIAFLFVLARTYVSKRFTHRQATSAIVVSYYWHFVDVVWIGLFTMIYLIQ